ncbi:hypothetical protein [Seinonella peptonophila]|uniref:hypothetical protein n=1 Tax=Seinonella peptonophila TaxID=112248 RepID=UPI00093239C0|nr:hypothetical protein [Seinonella peptonophila]
MTAAYPHPHDVVVLRDLLDRLAADSLIQETRAHIIWMLETYSIPYYSRLNPEMEEPFKQLIDGISDGDASTVQAAIEQIKALLPAC